MIASLLLLASAQGHVFDNFNDAELCGVIRRNVESTQAPLNAPITSNRLAADCASKQIRSNMKIALDGQAFDNYVVNFVGVARSGVCNMSDPTMKAFASRGWRFAYRFESTQGTVEERLLTC